MNDTITHIFLVFGGLGLFLYGMKMMMDGLEELAGNRMRTAIERATANRFLGVGVGALVTVVIQSSTATSVMAVGFINSGLMTLSQAITLIMGAHIGTTVTAHLFSFPGITAVAPMLIFTGIIIYLFVRKKGLKDFGFIFLGIGILFFGLSVMGGPLRAFADTEGFRSMLTVFSNPFLAIMAGFVFTAVIQSSTAATGILVTLYVQGVDIAFATAAYLVLGISAGTTVTALIASFAGKRESKRAALANLIYVSIGVVVFGVLISAAPGILAFFTHTWSYGATQIAMFYTFFKLALTLAFLPFVNRLAALMYKLMPKRTQWVDAKHLVYINHSGTQTPAAVIEQAFKELHRMGTMAVINLELAVEAFITGDEEKKTGVLEGMSSVNYLNKQITSLLMELEQVESAADMKRLSTLLYIASDFERVAAHAENIVGYDTRTKKKRKPRLSPIAMEELATMANEVISMLNLVLQAFENRSEAHLQQIFDTEDRVNALDKHYTENHIKRLKHEKSDPRGGVAFVGMVSDLERCADHGKNIAYYFQDKSV
ncbi:MAG: Na/Pi cotransporter family protein [Defluviitaleaceae bacterium]|nr:Na/Pi cotransporter family protein [Defluviitaleaceae bacterium]MCL2238431.1 Na/Pi cotransporter family protein [Defluviitaleaceae bacterium]